MALPSRSDMDPAYQWDLTQIYPSQEDWEAALEASRAQVADLGQLPGTLGRCKEDLKAGMDRVYETLEPVDRLYRYAALRLAGDNGDPEAQRLQGLARSLYMETSAALSFLEPEILAIPAETLEDWLRDPLLAGYRHILEDMTRTRAHILPAEQEQMLSLLSDAAGTPDDAFTMLSNVDMTFPDVTGEDGAPAPLTHGSYGRYRDSSVRSVRKEAFEAYHGQFREKIHTFAALYAGQVKLDAYYARVRGYGSALERSLDRKNVPLAVYETLVETIHEGIPVMARYLRLREKLLGLPALSMYDLYCPMVEGVRFEVDLDAAKTMVKAALRPLGPGYQDLLDMAFREKWMDVYENKGKTTGAFSMGLHGVHPFVLLNYQGTLQDVYTMAHELGHAMHSWLSSAHNSFANHDYEILVAEVASTVNEVLLTRHLLRTETDPKRRAFVLGYLLEGFRTTVFRQTLFAEFERKAHQRYEAGEPLTAEGLSAMFRELNLLYYPGVEVPELQDAEWARVPHFYSAFYVYQYATGFCSAVSIADRILETGDPSGYLRFLTTGGSDYPIEELKLAGVDLTEPQVVRSALRVFDASITELEQLVSSNNS